MTKHLKQPSRKGNLGEDNGNQAISLKTGFRVLCLAHLSL